MAPEANTSKPAKGKNMSDAEIIRQVEYYFSDENLPKDAYLLAKCGGHENKPVSIKSICNFPRMRRLPHTRVTDVLKTSTKLEVVDHTSVRRRDPLTLPLQVRPDDKETARQQLLSQPGMTKKLLEPTGFEEYYTDPPVTPEIYRHEREIFDPDHPFSDRIERAVQRYVAKRKFYNDAKLIFDSFLRFGGIETRPRISGHMSKEDMEGLTGEEIGEIMAVHWCQEEVSDPRKFRINIEGVTMAFLSVSATPNFYVDHANYARVSHKGPANNHASSSYAPRYHSVEFENPDKIKKVTNILHNFFNYLLIRDVAPDWAESIYAARVLCNRACTELTEIHFLRTFLPGLFNTACSMLFSSDSENTTSNANAGWDGESRPEPTFSTATARKIVQLAMATHGSEAQFAAAEQNPPSNITVVAELTRAFEVVAIESASPESAVHYNNPEFTGDSLAQPLGSLILKPYVLPDIVTYDLPAHITPDHPDHPEYCPDETYTIWLERDILNNFHFEPLTTRLPVPATPPASSPDSEPTWTYPERTATVGTKLVATLKKLQFGSTHTPEAEPIWFLDRWTAIHPSYYTVLANDMMRGYKKPRPSPRLLEAWGLTEDDVDEHGRILPAAMKAQGEGVGGGDGADVKTAEAAEGGEGGDDGAGTWGEPKGDESSFAKEEDEIDNEHKVFHDAESGGEIESKDDYVVE
ncbi:MAG: hypothetical protein M1822_006181 [Bathelium mastoideum]|nr:MAG: hypothetical protein M1822_006181 [Bathelium mastoideum]